jgi:hypothetical protein
MRSGNFRDFPGRVALIGLLRIGHVVGVVGVGAAVLHGEAVAGPFLALLVASGLGIAALDRWSNRAFLKQVSGLAVLLKIALLLAFAASATFGATAFWSLLIFSVAIAHAPGRVRHRRIV